MALIKKLPIWLIAFEIPIIYLAYQYLVRDSLAIYDASSHLAQVWYLKEYLWPNISGFNQFNLLGFDQGLMYPSLFHYVSAGLGFMVGVELAIKVVVIFALLLVPISLYLFVSLFFTNNNARAFIVGLLLVLLAALPGYFGANIKALAQVGLLPSFVSLPFVFLFFWSLLKAKSSWYHAALLLSVVLLTHLVAGLLCLITYFVFLSYQIFKKKFKVELLLTLVFALLLPAFFLIPFALNTSLLTQSVHLASLFLPNIAILILVSVLSYSFWKAKKESLFIVSMVAWILALIVTTDALVLRYSDTGLLWEKIYSLHLYRFQVYFYLISAIIIAYWPSHFLFEFLPKPKIKPQFIVGLPLLLLGFAFFVKTPFLANQVEINILDQKTEGRFLELFPRADAYPFIYAAQNKLVMDKNRPWAYGLLTDSNPNGPYIGSLIASFDPINNDEPTNNLVERTRIDRSRNYDVLDLFGVESLLLLNPNSGVTEKEINTILVKSGVGQSLIQIPGQTIEKSNGNWDSAVKNWWFEKGKLSSLLVENPEKIEQNKDAKISNITHNKNWSKFTFKVESDKEVPVLVKFTHLPGWQAVSGGQELKIHKASPYLMLVYAKGEVNFEYRKTWYQDLSLYLSAFSLVIFVVLVLRKPKAKNAKK